MSRRLEKRVRNQRNQWNERLSGPPRDVAAGWFDLVRRNLEWIEDAAEQRAKYKQLADLLRDFNTQVVLAPPVAPPPQYPIDHQVAGR